MGLRLAVALVIFASLCLPALGQPAPSESIPTKPAVLILVQLLGKDAEYVRISYQVPTVSREQANADVNRLSDLLGAELTNRQFESATLKPDKSSRMTAAFNAANIIQPMKGTFNLTALARAFAAYRHIQVFVNAPNVAYAGPTQHTDDAVSMNANGASFDIIVKTDDTSRIRIPDLKPAEPAHATDAPQPRGFSRLFVWSLGLIAVAAIIVFFVVCWVARRTAIHGG